MSGEPVLTSFQPLIDAAGALGVSVTERDAARLAQLLDELERWNRTFNLTAIRKRGDMVTRHLLDSLSVHVDLQGATVADVGTGAGFPGLPLAIVNPERRFTLIDSNGKKVRFVAHVARVLQLANVEVVHGRVEEVSGSQPFDTVIARAFAALPDMLARVAPLCGPRTRLLAMKGRWPQDEVAAIPAAWRVESSRQIRIPGLDEARCVIALRVHSSTEAPSSP